MTKRVLVLGGAGMLGHKLCQILSEEHETYATFHKNPPALPHVFQRTRALNGVDALNFETVANAIAEAQPDVVVNGIGIVKQLPAARDPVQSIAVNSLFPHRLAQLCEQKDALLVHISTDCVFSGVQGGYAEDDYPDPVDLYGRSKLLGEVEGPNALTIRTSIIGRELHSALGLVEWFLSKRGQSITGFSNAIFSGMTTAALARIIASLISRADLRGIWHVSSSPISKYELLRALNDGFQTHTTIQPDSSVRYDRSLRSDRFWTTTGLMRPDWTEMIQELCTDPTPYGVR